MYLKPLAARAYVLTVCAFVLQACSGGGSEDGGAPELESTIELSGSVGDGPIVGAQLTVRASSGEVLANVISDQRAAYTAQFKTKASH
jgi:hypothetical protein